jgi:tetratricopeptide (TPR) repeat protein
MLTTKNPRAKILGCLLLAVAILSGCTPPGPRALLHGKRLIEQRKFAQAVAELKSATSLLATNAQAWNYLGLAYHYTGQSADAQRAYERAVLLDHDLSEAHYNLGCLLLEINQTNAARNELTAFTLRRANSVDGLVKLGVAQSRCRDWASAEKTFRDALRLEAGNVEALNGLGLVRLQRGRPSEAVDCFNKALSKDANFSPALLNVAIVQQQYLKDRAAALQGYRQYVARTKDSGGAVAAVIRQLEVEVSPSPHPAAGAASSQPQSPQQITPTPPLTIQPAPQTKSIVTNLPVKTAAPKPGLTNVHPSVVTSQPPEHVELVRLEPEPAYRVAQDTAPAAPVSAVATPAPPLLAKASPALPPPKRSILQKINPMNLFRNDSKSDGATPSAEQSKRAPSESTPEALDSAIASSGDIARYSYLSPGRPVPGDRQAAEKYFAQGVQAQQSKRLPEAVQLYRQAIQIDPAYYEAVYNLGLVSAEQGNLRAALDYYETAMAIQPDSLDAQYNFALALKQGNYFQDSANEFDRILAKHPDEARVHLAVGNLYAQQLHQPIAARKHYLRVLETDPRNSQANAIRYWLTSNPP